jgi:prepilin-type N-terminal cleavage/methylation domain-containing protein
MRRSQNGFTLVELLVSIAVTLIVSAAAMMVYQRSVQVSNTVGLRSEMQAEIRTALNQISRDLNQAGTGIPIGGIPIPSTTTGGTNPKFGCDAPNGCAYLSASNRFTAGILYKLTPANGLGPTTTETTDAMVLTYMDPIAPAGDQLSSATGLNWGSYPTTTITKDGLTLTMPAGTTPALNDPQKGLAVGDMLLMTNSNGSAVGVVTGFDATARTITFASGDPLNFNQPNATTPVAGTLASIRLSPLPGVAPFFPPTSVSRIMMITYFIKQTTTSTGTDLTLMRQVGGRVPVPVAEHIEDLQVTYDLFNDATNALTTNLPDAVTGSPAVAQPSQIRKVNLTITARSPRLNAQGKFDRISMTTSLGPRNLSFHDRYN